MRAEGEERMGRGDHPRGERKRGKGRSAGRGEHNPDGGAELNREKNRARELRNTAWWRKKKSSGVCHYCARRFTPAELTMDHLIPLSRGGRSERHNIVPACKECNNKKKHMLASEWQEYLDLIKNEGR
jgi:5-methylcytosine-specific restriction enzyme A